MSSNGNTSSVYQFEILTNLPPVADFDYSPHNPIVGDKINFTDKSTDSDGSIVNWVWDFGDGAISYLQNPRHSYVHNGSYTVTLTVVDDSGSSDIVSKIVVVRPAPPPKPSPPTLPENLIVFNGPYEWNKTHWDITPETLICFDMEVAEKAGLYSMYYKIDGGNWTKYMECFTLPLGMRSICYYGVDGHGQITEAAQTVINVVGGVAPITTCILNPDKPNGNNGWYTTDVTITLCAMDNVSGVNATYYKLNNGNWQAYVNPIKIVADGKYTLQYYSIDNAGNSENVKVTEIKIDCIFPTVNLSEPNHGLYIMGRKILPLKCTIIIGKTPIIVNATDRTSGIEKVEFYVDDGLKATLIHEPYQWLWSNETAVGRFTLKAIAYDNSGNRATVEQRIGVFIISV